MAKIRYKSQPMHGFNYFQLTKNISARHTQPVSAKIISLDCFPLISIISKKELATSEKRKGRNPFFFVCSDRNEGLL